VLRVGGESTWVAHMPVPYSDANGVLYTNPGQRPGLDPHDISGALKARIIGNMTRMGTACGSYTPTSKTSLYLSVKIGRAKWDPWAALCNQKVL
jgi:hypothetical protein